MSQSSPTPLAAPEPAGWFGHPRQLARLFTTEMWERFGYYGMRALLALYLAQHFLFPDEVSNGLYGAFTSLVYLTPLIGGLIADRYLGSKRAVKFGAILMAAGYFLLCFGGEQAKPYLSYDGERYEVEKVSQGEESRQFVLAGSERFEVKAMTDGALVLEGSDGSILPRQLAQGTYAFDGARDPFWVGVLFLALSMVIVGNGFFKPNISTIVGGLYAEGDRRRDAGFTIFYMGINLGSIISQWFCPLFAVWFGWWAGFLLAAVGMLCAYVLFQFDGGRLDGHGEPPAGTEKSIKWIYLGALLAVPIAWLLMNNTMEAAAAARTSAETGGGMVGYLLALPILGKALFVTFLVAVIGIPIWAARAGTAAEFQKMVVAIVLVVFSVVFWTLFEQAGSSMTYFADRNTDLSIAGVYTMPAGQVQIFNPLFIVIFAPLFSVLWVVLAKRGLEPSIPTKFAIGLVLAGLGFLVLVYGAQFADTKTYQVALVWLALAYFLHSLGELCLSPVGLSMITKLSIARIVGMMMGVWFLSSSMAQYVGGIVAQAASTETVGGEVLNPKLALETYVNVFQTIGYSGIGFGILLLIATPLLKRWMHGVQ
jgi:proton-dependent oligopeptide transporter, POT family